MSNKNVVLKFLSNNPSEEFTNSDIRSRTGIKPHQQIFQITKLLMDQGVIRGRQKGKEWFFTALKNPIKVETSTLRNSNALTHQEFEIFAQKVMSRKFNTDLKPRLVSEVGKKFDLVSEDYKIIGDAKYYTAVNGTSIPPAKFSVIAEYVWLMENTKADQKFLVFGNDRRVPEWWLKKYGKLITDIQFYFLDQEGTLDLIK
jgi:hypothetical protein